MNMVIALRFTAYLSGNLMTEPKDPRGKLGAKGERLAEKYLKSHGFKPVARNLTRKIGEIDLLMWDTEELVIVEVRTVTDSKYNDPNDRIPVSKRRQLTRVARQLESELPDPLPPIRFDVCIVTMQPEPVVHHLKHAFVPVSTPYRRR